MGDLKAGKAKPLRRGAGCFHTPLLERTQGRQPETTAKEDSAECPCRSTAKAPSSSGGGSPGQDKHLCVTLSQTGLDLARTTREVPSPGVEGLEVQTHLTCIVSKTEPTQSKPAKGKEIKQNNNRKIDYKPDLPTFFFFFFFFQH